MHVVDCAPDAECALQDIRIHHTIVLDDPYDDPAGLEVMLGKTCPAVIADTECIQIPPASPERVTEPSAVGRIGECLFQSIN